jgi:hypothetical protein
MGEDVSQSKFEWDQYFGSQMTNVANHRRRVSHWFRIPSSTRRKHASRLRTIRRSRGTRIWLFPKSSN